MMKLALLISLLRMDIESGAVIERQWDGDATVPGGSLAKPFLALAYAQHHGFRYPVIRCKKCWLPRGHGEVGIMEAIAQSCNTYFDALATALRPDQIEAVALRFGLASVFEARPEEMLRAYVELSRRASEPGAAEILGGMRRAATRGTAKAIGEGALAKTGTAPCRHSPPAPGDGFAVVLYPAEKPRTALLVRVHGRPGSHAAAEAARLMETVKRGRE
jgi:cell division protein FtsI/penicillin-binding protein 2